MIRFYFAVPNSVTNRELDVLVNIGSLDDITVKIVLDIVQAISGLHTPEDYNVSVNLINTDKPLENNIYNCSSIDQESGTNNITLTLNCDIQLQQLCTFNISASNEAGDALIFQNGKLSKFLMYT